MSTDLLLIGTNDPSAETRILVHCLSGLHPIVLESRMLNSNNFPDVSNVGVTNLGSTTTNMQRTDKANHLQGTAT